MKSAAANGGDARGNGHGRKHGTILKEIRRDFREPLRHGHRSEAGTAVERVGTKPGNARGDIRGSEPRAVLERIAANGPQALRHGNLFQPTGRKGIAANGGDPLFQDNTGDFGSLGIPRSRGAFSVIRHFAAAGNGQHAVGGEDVGKVFAAAAPDGPADRANIIHKLMAGRNDLLRNEDLAADGAVLALRQAILGAGSGNGLVHDLRVSRRRNRLLLLEHIAADGAVLSFREAGGFALRRNPGQDPLRMPGRITGDLRERQVHIVPAFRLLDQHICLGAEATRYRHIHLAAVGMEGVTAAGVHKVEPDIRIGKGRLLHLIAALKHKGTDVAAFHSRGFQTVAGEEQLIAGAGAAILPVHHHGPRNGDTGQSVAVGEDAFSRGYGSGAEINVLQAVTAGKAVVPQGQGSAAEGHGFQAAAIEGIAADACHALRDIEAADAASHRLPGCLVRCLIGMAVVRHSAAAQKEEVAVAVQRPQQIPGLAGRAGCLQDQIRSGSGQPSRRHAGIQPVIDCDPAGDPGIRYVHHRGAAAGDAASQPEASAGIAFGTRLVLKAQGRIGPYGVKLRGPAEIELIAADIRRPVEGAAADIRSAPHTQGLSVVSRDGASGNRRRRGAFKIQDSRVRAGDGTVRHGQRRVFLQDNALSIPGLNGTAPDIHLAADGIDARVAAADCAVPEGEGTAFVLNADLRRRAGGGIGVRADFAGALAVCDQQGASLRYAESGSISASTEGMSVQTDVNRARNGIVAGAGCVLSQIKSGSADTGGPIPGGPCVIRVPLRTVHVAANGVRMGSRRSDRIGGTIIRRGDDPRRVGRHAAFPGGDDTPVGPGRVGRIRLKTGNGQLRTHGVFHVLPVREIRRAVQNLPLVGNGRSESLDEEGRRSVLVNDRVRQRIYRQHGLLRHCRFRNHRNHRILRRTGGFRDRFRPFRGFRFRSLGLYRLFRLRRLLRQGRHRQIPQHQHQCQKEADHSFQA